MSPADPVSPALTDWRVLHGGHFEGARVLVTGGAGFIGSHLCDALVCLGAQVVALDDLSGGDRKNVADAAGAGALELVTASILDEAAVKDAMKGCQYVLHQAALPSVPRSIEMPRRFHDVNVTGSQIILDTAVDQKVGRLVFAASSSAYGDTPSLPKVETMVPLPKSPYAANKLAGENLMHAYASCYPIDTAALRYFNVFGPRQNANSVYSGVIAAFARALHTGEPPTIHGDGTQTRDFTFVDNAVQANLLAARHDGRIGGQAINVACGEAVSISELARQMADAMNKPDLRGRHGPPRAGDVTHSLADLQRARSVLGYEPIVDFESGLRATVQWYEGTLG